MKKAVFVLCNLVLIVLLQLSLVAGGALGRQVVVGDGYEYPPFTFYDGKGQPTGFNIELMQLIGEALGWEVEIRLAPWLETKERLAKGEIDMVAGMFYSPERAEGYSFSSHHSVASGDIFSRPGTSVGSVEELWGKRVAVQNDDILYHYLREQQLGLDFVVVPYVSDALRLVSVGEVEYAALVTIPAYYAIEHEKIDNVRGNGLHIAPLDYCFIVPRGKGALLAELEKGLRLVKSTERFDELTAKWLSPYMSPKNERLGGPDWRGLGILAGVAVLASTWALALRRTVKVRTADLEKANKQFVTNQKTLRQTTERLRKTVAELTETALQLTEQKDLLQTTLLSLGDGVVLTDSAGKVTMLNPMAEALTGWTQSAAAGRPFSQLFPGEYSHIVEQVLDTKQLTKIGHFKLTPLNADTIDAAATISPIRDSKGVVQGAVAVCRDISEAVSQNQKIEFLSYRDPLTGVWNRRAFSREKERLDQEYFLPLSIIVADVNGLKFANDVFGHTVGDQLLVAVSEVLTSVIGECGLVARVGGDEFAALLPRTTLSEAEQLVKKLKELVKEETVELVRISVAFGTGAKTSAEQDLDEVFAAAEREMYSKKLLTSPNKEMVDLMVYSLFGQHVSEREHAERVAELSAAFGKAWGQSVRQIEELYNTGLLHDIGKAVSRHRGSEGEEHRHPELGYRVLRTARNMERIAWNILAHHERYDGKGYPKGLKGQEIPFQARIVSITNAYDRFSMLVEGGSRRQAVQKLQAGAGTYFDPQLVQFFLEKVLPGL